MFINGRFLKISFNLFLFIEKITLKTLHICNLISIVPSALDLELVTWGMQLKFNDFRFPISIKLTTINKQAWYVLNFKLSWICLF